MRQLFLEIDLKNKNNLKIIFINKINNYFKQNYNK